MDVRARRWNDVGVVVVVVDVVDMCVDVDVALENEVVAFEGGNGAVREAVMCVIVAVGVVDIGVGVGVGVVAVHHEE